MIHIEDLTLLDIAARSTLEDVNTKYIYESIDYAINIRNEENKEKFFQDLETISEEEVDELLWEFDVRNMTPNIDVEYKVELLKKALISNFNKGTVGSIKNVSDVLFGNADIHEWFEYNGSPGYFKVSTTADINGEDKLDMMFNIVNEYKNTRSWFDGFQFLRETRLENLILNLFSSKVTNSINMREFELPWFNNTLNSEMMSNTTVRNELSIRE